MPRYYTTPRIGTGTDRDPYRPDVPAGVEWAAHVGAAECLVVTDAAIPGRAGQVELPEGAARTATLARLGLSAADVRGWLGGGV